MRLRCRTTYLLTSFPPVIGGVQRRFEARPWPCEAEEGAVGERNRATIVEVELSGLTWRKSTASSGNPNSCVEVASSQALVLVRNSRDRLGARLSLAHSAWVTQLVSAREGALDLTR